MAERQLLHLLAVVLIHVVFLTSVNADAVARRVLLGLKAKPGQFPSVVLVEFKEDRRKCTGTLVSMQWVLTAAHCVPPDDVSAIKLVAGVIDEHRGNRSQIREGKQVVFHPRFNEAHLQYDLALIQTNESFSYTEYVRPINTIANPKIPKGEMWHCRTVGYGLSNVKELNLSHNVDELRFQSVTVSDLSLCPLYNASDREAHLICSVIKEGRGICEGDEGAPVVCQGVQVGTMSSIEYTSPRTNATVKEGEIRCGVPQDTMKIEFLGYYVNWLKANVKDLMEPLTLRSEREKEQARSCDEPRTPLQVATCVLLPLLNMLLMVNCILKPRWNFHIKAAYP